VLVLWSELISYRFSIGQWRTNLLDADKALGTFFTGCFEAGPEGCAFYAESPEAIQQNFTNIFESLRAQPIPIKTDSTYGILDHTTVRVVVLTALTSPYALFPVTAQGLAQLATGNGTSLFQLLNPPGSQFQYSCDPEAYADDQVADASTAIICNDGDEVPTDLNSAKEYYDEMTNLTDWAEVWLEGRLNCMQVLYLPFLDTPLIVDKR